MPTFYFGIGFCLVLLVSWFPILQGLDVSMQFWRAEVASSIILTGSLIFLLYKSSKEIANHSLSSQEINWIVLPLAAFILWSGISMFWAASWKLALYHTLVWTQYLIFYLVVRRVLEKPNAYNLLITLLSTVLLIVGLPAIIEYVSFLYLGGGTSLGIRFSKYGEIVFAVFPLIIAGVLRLSGRGFAAGVFLVTSLWLFTLSSLSRTNFILFVTGMIGIAGIIFAFKRFRRYRIKVALIVASLFFISIPVHSVAFLTEKPNVPIVSRVSDEEGIGYSNDFRKLMMSVSKEMIAANWLIGIGAGNYGMQFDRYREIYAVRNPTDGNLTVAENELAERAHNEYLQIFTELGIVGVLIFAWFLAVIAVMGWNALKNWRRTSLYSLGALLGLALFLISSAVTSFSFRFLQNGFVFFFVLAVAAKLLLKARTEKKTNPLISLSNSQLKFAYSFGIALCLLLFGHCSIRVASAVYTALGNGTPEFERAEKLYRTSAWLDNENPNADYFYAVRLLKENRPAEAVPYFKRATTLGLGTSSVYSYLATAQTLAGDRIGAEDSFAKAVRLYPLSPFVRTRYAALLQANGKIAESAQQFEYARQINKKSANTWWSLINQGVMETTRTAYREKDYVQVLDLKPPQSVEAVITERNIKNPAEKVEFNFPD